MKQAYLAVDFGGGSGRVIAGTLHEGKLTLTEIYRFPNRQIKLGNHLYWDFLALFENMKIGLKKAAQNGYHVRSIGIDTWGVDFGLIDDKGNLLGNPVCYRDERTVGTTDEVFKIIDLPTHYASAGIQVMALNTLFQLFSMKKSGDKLLGIADKLLFMPDLFSFYLTGTANNEYCIASTSELLDAKSKAWSAELIRRLGLPEHLFGEIVMPSTKRGKLKKEIADETGQHDAEVIAVASHDTASAVLAVPSTKKQKVFLSSGTWSLLGAVVDEPILTEEARRAGFTNEGGVDGIRFLQNITGLWILQQLVGEWEKTENRRVDYDELIHEAEHSASTSLIDVDDSAFLNPESMRQTIKTYCETAGGKVPQTRGEFTRCVLESLAERYKRGIDELQKFLKSPITELHIIGGGSQNKMLNQLTANRLNIPVIAGPVEATAIGNILMQAKTMGEITSLEALKECVIDSVDIRIFKPIV